MAYNPRLIEGKWQNYWIKNKTFKAEIDKKRKKLYILDMFPYPSGEGLHVGHIEGYTATDIYSRFKRMQGFNVLHTMGWDAFGLPAEQYAIRTGKHPADTTLKNINNFKNQIQSMGFSYDWDREITTSDPKYFKWTQWIFLQLYKQGLAYQDDALVNWCPKLKAVLANEEVVDGLSEIGSYPVVRIPLKQWLLKITKYADKLEDDLSQLDWPPAIIEMQKNWIGKSIGTNCKFKVKGSDETFTVFTTRPDTLFGATYCVLAPEHELIAKIVTKGQKKRVKEYIASAQQLSDRERLNEQKEKTGVFSGSYAINPVNNKKVQIWIADYVIGKYGTGAIMAVPGHDKRDLLFANKYNLPIVKVIESNEECYTGEGILKNSGFINGLDSTIARKKVTEYLVQNSQGEETVNYKLRDWIFTRQRYWGEPIPIIFDNQNDPFALKQEELPLELPKIKNYKPADNGESPLKNAKDWVNIKINGDEYKRETNTMPQWAGSCWYYLRFIDPNNEHQPFSAEAEKYWMPVDLYIGGAEHAVLHLLYARFWHKVLYKIGLVSTKEPFMKLINQGIILGEDGVKMSKSRGNVINPTSIIEKYGADTLRLFEMFLGPLEKSKPWQSGGLEGLYRFLKRIWNWLIEDETDKLKDIITKSKPSEVEQKLINQLIVKVTSDIEKFKFNTAISACMIFFNQISKLTKVSKETINKFILLLNPFVPHIAEELWQKIGNENNLSYQTWPCVEKKWLSVDKITIPIQINGKTRVKLNVETNIDQDKLLSLAKKEKILQKYFENSTIIKVIYVSNRILNIILVKKQ